VQRDRHARRVAHIECLLKSESILREVVGPRVVLLALVFANIQLLCVRLRRELRHITVEVAYQLIEEDLRLSGISFARDAELNGVLGYFFTRFVQLCEHFFPHLLQQWIELIVFWVVRGRLHQAQGDSQWTHCVFKADVNRVALALGVVCQVLAVGRILVRDKVALFAADGLHHEGEHVGGLSTQLADPRHKNLVLHSALLRVKWLRRIVLIRYVLIVYA